MREKWHSWFDYRWGLWAAVTWAACGYFRQRQGELEADSILIDRWLLLVFLLLRELPTWWYSVQMLLRRPDDKSPEFQVTRATWVAPVNHMLGHIFVLCVLVASFGRVWTFADVGFRTASPWSWTILVGLLCCHFMIKAQNVLAGFLYRQNAELEEQQRRMFVTMQLARGRVAQVLDVINSGIVCPIHEELVYRGFLVYMLANLTQLPWLAILFGLVICLIVHLYQGWWAIPTHILFYVGFVALLFSPAGLLAGISMHVANNTQSWLRWVFFAREYVAHLRGWRLQRQEQRSLATAEVSPLEPPPCP
ncbi:CPBP family intramembrane glutamic endopeptidase [Anatilimnocola sp. NA78]|uniref:CPBP family intramembrane glutamic endopeptidase n=1 Tax=Anatilimnocola sp. NA78 TaxID=3415683 RepID=UPI003CE5395D